MYSHMLKDDKFWKRILVVLHISIAEFWVSLIDDTTKDLQLQEEMKWCIECLYKR